MTNIIARLLPLILLVEGADDAAIIADRGSNSYGAYQIKQCVISDVNRVYGTSLTVDSALNRRKARAVACMYLLHWGEVYSRRTGKSASMEVLARIWNGGPRGYERASTEAYWRKICQKKQ